MRLAVPGGGELPLPGERPVVIDWFCGAGGVTKGLQEVGFFVIGVDKKPQKRYCGDVFIEADAVEEFHVVLASVPYEPVGHAASPPCQNSTQMKTRHADRTYPELIPPTRELLVATGLPYVIENVEGARRKLINPVQLCGSAFQLEVRRHRLFEANFPIEEPGCSHATQGPVVGVYGHTGAGTNRGQFRKRGQRNGVEDWRRAMEIPWMTVAELSQAIPPAYARHVGLAMRRELERRAGNRETLRRLMV